MRSLPVAGGAVLALLLLLVAVSGVTALESLTLLSPAVTANSFNYNGVPGLMYSEPSLFGLPNYNADLQAMVKQDAANDNLWGCKDYADGFLPAPNGKSPPLVALVQRGNCTFGQKALKAQAAGASAIIVYDDEPESPGSLPKMAGGEVMLQITIPGMLVLFKDGKILQQAYTEYLFAQKKGETGSSFYNGVWVSLTYSLIAPDDRVEWDLFFYPDEPHIAPFIEAYQPVVRALGDRAQFTPHFRIIDGDTVGCMRPEGKVCNDTYLPCGTQCTNCGRYCRLDPNGKINSPPEGRDVVTQSVIQKCLYTWSQENKQPLLWWQYVDARQKLNCAADKDVSGCTNRALSKAHVPQSAINHIMNVCKGDTGMYTDEDNFVLENELQWQYDYLPLTSPYLYVNGYPYYGGFVCPSPVNVGSCAPLSVMCAGYLAGTAPAVCNANGCETGVDRDACGVCGGSATKDEDCVARSKFPIGSVIGVIIVCCVLIGGGVYWYMRRQNTKMRDDIDSLLKQYLPMSDQEALAGTNGKTAGAAREQHSNLRLIGNLDTSDEPTDL